MSETRNLNVRLPVELHDRLTAEAEDRGLASSVLVRRALADYLDRLLPIDEALRLRPPGRPGPS